MAGPASLFVCNWCVRLGRTVIRGCASSSVLGQSIRRPISARLALFLVLPLGSTAARVEFVGRVVPELARLPQVVEPASPFRPPREARKVGGIPGAMRAFGSPPACPAARCGARVDVNVAQPARGNIGTHLSQVGTTTSGSSWIPGGSCHRDLADKAASCTAFAQSSRSVLMNLAIRALWGRMRMASWCAPPCRVTISTPSSKAIRNVSTCSLPSADVMSRPTTNSTTFARIANCLSISSEPAVSGRAPLGMNERTSNPARELIWSATQIVARASSLRTPCN